jgi:outer membrane protein assembly factor BamD
LYSRADEAYYLLGQNYEGQIYRIRKSPTCDVHMLPRGCMREADKARAITQLSKEAAKKYSMILTRYPVMDRAEDAKKRLEALNEPVPRPTKAAVALNKAEVDSRGERTMLGQMKLLIKRGPDVSQAPTVGNPPLVDPEPVSAKDVAAAEQRTFVEPGSGGRNQVGVTIINPNQPANTAPPADGAPNPNPFGTPPATAATPPAPATNDPNELKPNQPADPNELTPTNTGADNSLPPPTQVNEIQNPSSSSTANAGDSTPATDEDISSSKRKKKKGLKKINPF